MFVGRSSSEHAIKAAGDFASFGIRHRFEIGLDQFAIDNVIDSGKHAIALIAFVSADQQLCCQQIAITAFDLEVDVRCRVSGIGDRVNCPETVFAGGTRFEAAEALKILILL